MEFYREEIKKQLFWEKTVKAVILKMYKQKILPLLKARIWISDFDNSSHIKIINDQVTSGQRGIENTKVKGNNKWDLDMKNRATLCSKKFQRDNIDPIMVWRESLKAEKNQTISSDTNKKYLKW